MGWEVSRVSTAPWERRGGSDDRLVSAVGSLVDEGIDLLPSFALRRSGREQRGEEKRKCGAVYESFY